MAKKYIIGELSTGAILETSELPVVKGDNISFDIQGVDQAEISVSKLNLPNPALWKDYLRVGRKLVLAVDDEKAWNDHGNAIIGGGFILRLQARVNDTIRIKIAGPDEYLNRRVISSVFTGAVVNPTVQAINLTRNSYQGLITELIRDAFTAKGTGTRPTPPQIPITYPTTTTGAIAYSALNTDFITYSQALEELQNASPFGNEWKWQWQWTSSAKTNVRLLLTVGADTTLITSQIGSNVQDNIVLDNTVFKLVAFDESDDLDNSATRLISQTKQGAEIAGSDYVITVNAENDILFDSTFNPGVELTAPQLTAQITSRMSVLKNLQGKATIEIAEPLTSWVGKLGNIINISGGVDWRTSGYTIQVRITKVSGNVVDSKCKIEISPILPRYPKLPPSSPFTPGAGATSNPISSRNPPNFKPIGGGGTPFVPPAFGPGMTGLPAGTLIQNSRLSDVPFRALGGVASATIVEWKDHIYAISTPNFYKDSAPTAGENSLNIRVIAALKPTSYTGAWGPRIESGTIPGSIILPNIGTIGLFSSNNWRVNIVPFAGANRLWVLITGTRDRVNFGQFLYSAPILNGVINGAWVQASTPSLGVSTIIINEKNIAVFGVEKNKVVIATTAERPNNSPGFVSGFIRNQRCFTTVLNTDGSITGWTDQFFPTHSLRNNDSNGVQATTDATGQTIYLWNYATLPLNSEIAFIKATEANPEWAGVAIFNSGSVSSNLGGFIVSPSGKRSIFVMPSYPSYDAAIPAAQTDVRNHGGSQQTLWATPNGKMRQPAIAGVASSTYGEFMTIPSLSILAPFDIFSGGGSGWNRDYSSQSSKMFFTNDFSAGFIINSAFQQLGGFSLVISLNPEGV